MLAERFATMEHPNLQLALDTLLAADEDQSVLGLPTDLRHYEFSVAGALAGRFHGPAEPSPIEYVNVPVAVDRSLPCAQLAVYLLRWSGVPVVAFLLWVDDHMGGGPRLEVLAPDRRHAEGFLVRLRELMLEHNVYRGKLLAFSFGEYGGFGLTFQRLPTVTRDDLILPAADLEAIERHTVGIAERAVEIGLPDDESRRRLLRLHLHGVAHEAEDVEGVVDRTAGVSAAFIKELVRRATMLSLDDAADPPVLRSVHLERALDDLLEHSAPVLRSMLGAGWEGGAQAAVGSDVPPSWDRPPPGWVRAPSGHDG